MTTTPETVEKRLLPELWRVARIARELGMHANSLVQASRRGQWVPVLQIGRTWWARAEDVKAWLRTKPREVSPLLLDRVRAAGAPPDGAPRQRHRRQPRADTGASC